MRENHDTISDDLAALSRVPRRFAGTEGEREMLQSVRDRLPAGVVGKTEGFVAHLSPHVWTGAHALLLLFAGVIGYRWPGIGAVLCAVLTLALLGEGLGRFSLLRWWAPRHPSYNLVVKQDGERSLGAVVIAAPLDIPRWRPWSRRVSTFRPLQILLAASTLVTVLLFLRAFAEPWGRPSVGMYAAALLVQAGTAVIGGLAQRLTDSTEEASGPATLLEIVRRVQEDPVPGVQVWAVFTGCGRAFQGGMEAFLQLHGPNLPDPVLVIALDDAGRSPLHAAVSEGPLLKQYHRSTGPALVERLRWAGVAVPAIDHNQATDARVALLHGYRGIALVGGDGASSPESVSSTADVVETVVRWYGEDLAGVASKAPGLEALARSTNEARERAEERRRSRRRRSAPEARDAAVEAPELLSEEDAASGAAEPPSAEASEARTLSPDPEPTDGSEPSSDAGPASQKGA